MDIIEGEVVGAASVGVAPASQEGRAKSGRKAGPARGPRAVSVGGDPAAGLEAAEGRSRRDGSEADPEGGRLAAGKAGQRPHEALHGAQERFAAALADGASPTEARQIAGVTAEKANGYLSDPATGGRVAFLASQRVKSLSGAALQRVETLLAARSERVQLDAALAILDRSGIGINDIGQASPVTVVIDLTGRR